MIRLIVSADDFGYFRCVSQGVLEAAAAGAVTATSVMANGPALEECAPELARLDGVDVGVHLNLSLGAPLTPEMARHLAPCGGRFPGRYGAALRVLAGRIPRSAVAGEWAAQVRRCRDLGLNPLFLNSHEHLHMLPGLLGLALDLARREGIPFVRRTGPEWLPVEGAGAVARNAILLGLRLAALAQPFPPGPRLLGVAVSTGLSPQYLERAVAGLRPGRAYELMCHPGRRDDAEVGDPALAAGHRWEAELAALTDGRLTELLRKRGAVLARFRDLLPS